MALTERQYRWRHNKIGLLLNVEKECFMEENDKGPTIINFLTKQAAATKDTRQSTGELTTSDDWELEVEVSTELS